MKRNNILITADDYKRLEQLLTSNMAHRISSTDRLEELRAELDRAQIVSPIHVPEDLVTMGATVKLRDLDTNETETYTLVYPAQADIANGLLSVLAPVGTAILGYQVGDRVRWRVPEGWRRLLIERVVHRPPAELAGERYRERATVNL